MSSILITGGSGYFGKAMVTHLLKDDTYERICIYSRDEAKQAVIRESFNNDKRLRFFVGCIRDKDRLKRAMNGVDHVIHAAALKRIEVGHYAPDEMAKTNIFGTMNIVDACASSGVKKAVLLSSDKAYQPISPYGQSKALAESLFLGGNNIYGEHGPIYSVVRYGNVAGSTGSVIPRWREQLKNSDTVNVTDPECTRFWMFVGEAIDLVIRSLKRKEAISFPSIPVLPAYRLGDLAEAMGAKMNIIGLPVYEKKNESMDEWNCSKDARRMSVDELREKLKNV